MKHAYAVRFAEHMSLQIASDFSSRLPDIAVTTKRALGAMRGIRQLDVNFSSLELGLVLGISLKSAHFPDVKGAARYTHDVKRSQDEWRNEATVYHRRAPYAVLVGVLLLPFDSCQDGTNGEPSSFGSWVRHLRPFAGRQAHRDDAGRLERIFIALYEPDGSTMRFFDVTCNPPKNGRPRLLRSYVEFLDDVYLTYVTRNGPEFTWAQDDEEFLDVEPPEMPNNKGN